MNRLKTVIVQFFVISSILCWSNIYAETDGLTADVVTQLKRVSSVSVSPSGANVAFTLSVPRAEDAKPGASRSELWVVSSNGGDARQYLGSPMSASSVTWSSDGKNLTFLSRMEAFNKYVQIYSMPLNGGSPQLLSDHSNSIAAYKWSPDGKSIAFISTDAASSDEKADKAAGKDWVIYDTNFKHRRLWVLDVASGDAHLLMSDDQSIWDFVWSPNSKTLAFQATETPLVDDSYMFKKIYTIAVDGGDQKLLCKTEGKLAGMAYSPDGKQFAYLGAVDISDPLAQSLFVVSATGGEAKNLMDGYEGTANSFRWVDNKTAMLVITEGSTNVIRTLDVKTGKMKSVFAPEVIVGSVSASSDGKVMAVAASHAAHPPEVYRVDVKKKSATRLTHHNAELGDISMARQEVFEWNGADNWSMEGVLTYPLGYSEGTAYPLILQIHGGPEGVSLNGWTTTATYPVQILAAQGYMVLQPNYRGSAGKGVAFTKADHDDLGGKEFEDVLAGIDALIDRGMVDADRVGTGGWSYGGYFSAWAATRHSERFKAAVVAAGLTNWISFAGTTDIPYEMSLVHWNSWWMDQRELHWERSPLYHIGNAQTPTLVVHGMKDVRVHPEQGIELYQTLKIRDVDSRLILYPREPHGILEVPHQLHYVEEVLKWFDQYVKGEGAEQKEVIN